MKIICFAFILVISFSHVFAQKSNRNHTKKSHLELPHIEVIPVTETRTGRQYDLYVKLPEGYSENDHIEYPVIYFTDAMWHVELLSGITAYIMEKAILVGVSWQKDIDKDLKKEVGVHVSRYRDYSIRKSNDKERQARYQFGAANNHLNFIRNDVITYVENNYRTEADNRTYFGYSMGGELGAYILLTQPDTFRNYILGSPSLHNDIQLLSEFKFKHKRLNANVFISYGALEKKLGKSAKTFIGMLKSRNDTSLFLKHIVIEGSHQTAFPITCVQGIHWLSDLIK
ncbi:alpha/beta hydrolase [Flavivirga algicola]|uniref:Alpha/beta hydrolase n=1 Tax=Flavivirga algicola TaxID=2729136 RepID=A0ABX1RXE8_9FLAO|nr:alpha/beta hydrolase-fold protein [Flavivirga algicola]NMH88242.1 alpha/beta hydrolase [Flavivirga algicola]